MKIKLLFFLSFISFPLCAQVDVGDVHIIDDSDTAVGITHISAADLDNDGSLELLVSEPYDSDRIVVYWNDGNANFTSEIVDDNFPEAVYVTAADVNGNGFKDIMAISQTDGNLVWYPNNNGTFGTRTTIDSEDSFGIGIIPGDFDENGTQDLVVVWEHYINFYRNDGSGNFTKETISTSTTDPNGFRCFDITQADVNQDGHLDVITGQNRGSIVFENDGNGNFTQNLITMPEQAGITAQEAIDVNQDNFPDFIMQGPTGDVSLYLNPGDSSFDFTFEGDLFQAGIGAIKEFAVADVDNDGNPDFYYADQGIPQLRLSGDEMDFSESVPLNVDESLFVQHVLTADIDNDGKKEFIWSVPAGTLAYQDNEALSVENNKQNEFKVYPNPASANIHIQTNSPSATIGFSMVNLQGKLIKRGKTTANEGIDVQKLAAGIYFLNLSTGNGIQQTKKIVVKH